MAEFLKKTLPSHPGFTHLNDLSHIKWVKCCCNVFLLVSTGLVLILKEIQRRGEHFFRIFYFSYKTGLGFILVTIFYIHRSRLPINIVQSLSSLEKVTQKFFFSSIYFLNGKIARVHEINIFWTKHLCEMVSSPDWIKKRLDFHDETEWEISF